MFNPKKDYIRTTAALSLLSSQFKTPWKPQSNVSLEAQLANFINGQIKAKTNAYDLLNEIFAIEQEKKSFRNKESEREIIAEQEKANYRHRESLLHKDLNQIGDLIFVQNPLVKTYESYWNWSQNELIENPRQFQELLQSKKEDCFFVLQQTGSFDEKSESNILELPLTEYQYFILGLFQEPVKLNNAKQKFKDQFVVEKPEEANQLQQMTHTLLRELIFRTFIIRAEF